MKRRENKITKKSEHKQKFRQIENRDNENRYKK